MFPLLGQVTPEQLRAIADGGTKGLITALVLAIVALAMVCAYLGKKLYENQKDENKTLLAMTERVTTALVTMATAADALKAATETSQETARLLEYVIDNPPGAQNPPAKGGRR